MVKVCSKTTTITKLIIGYSQSRGCAMRVTNYENNKLNGLVKPETGVEILVNSTRYSEFNEKSSDFFLWQCQCCGYQ
jgi:hypothetical protein